MDIVHTSVDSGQIFLKTRQSLSKNKNFALFSINSSIYFLNFIAKNYITFVNREIS